MHVPQVAHTDTSSSINVLKTALEGLIDSLVELSPLQVTVGVLLKCIVRLQVEEQNCQTYEELALELAKSAATLQEQIVESRPHDGPDSIANVTRAINEQTRLIEAQQEQPQTGRLMAAKEDKELISKCYRRITVLFQQLQADILLSVWDDSKERDMEARLRGLSPLYDAYYNAALSTSVTQRVVCTPGTRVQVLENVRSWACRVDTRVYWMNGRAGTGKTTIAYTLCEMLQVTKQLGASFFCSRLLPDLRDLNRVVPTIAYQLGQYSGPYRQALCDALRSDPDAPKRSIGTQFDHLIAKPFARVAHAMPEGVIVVIDALDECADGAGTQGMLNMLIRHAANLPIKFFVTSRLEPVIFRSVAALNDWPSILHLHDIDQSLVEANIELYLTEALASILLPIPEIVRLTTQADRLFIFAATAVHWIMSPKGSVNCRARVRVVLGLQSRQKHGGYQSIDDLYAAILAYALNESIFEAEEIEMIRRALRTVICAREPLTIPVLAEMLRVSDEDIQAAVRPLHPLLHMSEITNAVSAFHVSFSDFLLTEERAGRFYCNEVIDNSYLAECCFRVMGQSLGFNICALESSYAFDRDVPALQYRVSDAISPGLRYSCGYWADHLTKCPPSPALLSLLDLFLERHLLFWMEVLNLNGRIGNGKDALSKVLDWLPVSVLHSELSPSAHAHKAQTGDQWTELWNLAYDAYNFLTSFARNPTSHSTPHIYVSALAFTSRESRVWRNYWPRMRGLMSIKGTAIEGRSRFALETWDVGSGVDSIAQSSDGRHIAAGSGSKGVSTWNISSGIYTMARSEGHRDRVWSVAFSPDSTRIASSSWDQTICIWDAYSGDLIVKLTQEHTEDVNTVSFSPDGTRLASGSSDFTIRMWDADTGDAVGGAYKGHEDIVWSVAFSPDGEHLASGSADCTIRIWYWRTGVAARKPLEGHTEPVRSVAYSSDGRRLASGSEDCAVRAWDMPSGTPLPHQFKGHSNAVLSVSFSPNSTQIVSGSCDCTICVWDVESGNLAAGPFKEHSGPVRSVFFTTHGTRIVSGSDDGTIRTWDMRYKARDATEVLGPTSNVYSVTISRDGTHAAFGSNDHTVSIWDLRSSSLVAGPLEGHTQEVRSVSFSPDGKLVASGSNDRTLRTWDASTSALLAGPFEGHTGSVRSVAFSPDGKQIASGSDDNTIRRWHSDIGKSVGDPFKGHTNTIASISFSPNGARIVSGSHDKTVRMWGANDGATLWMSGAHSDRVRCVAFSPDGTRVVSGSHDQTILVLDAGGGVVLHGPFKGHTGTVLSVAFSLDGMRVISGSVDQTVRVWDVRSGVVVAGPFSGHKGSVVSVALSPDGSHAISGSADGAIRFHDVAVVNQTAAALYDGWSIDDDGWLTDSESHRLVWVPVDLRREFWIPTPSYPLTLTASCATRIDGTLLGDRWHECYAPL